MMTSDQSGESSDSNKSTSASISEGQESQQSEQMSERVRNGMPSDKDVFLLPTAWYLPGIVDPDYMINLDEDTLVPRDEGKEFLDQLRIDFAQLDSQPAGNES